MSYMLGAALLVAAQSLPTAPPVSDPLAAIPGDWQIVDLATGKPLQDCTKAQSFVVSADRKSVILTEKWADNWTARYAVLHHEADRVLTIIEGEQRKTETGDPVLFWAHFDGPDKFRWRRYDWAPDVRTTTQWQRCPARAPSTTPVKAQPK